MNATDFEALLPELFWFAYLATSDRETAERFIFDLVTSEYVPLAEVSRDDLIGFLARGVEASFPRRPDTTFTILDQTLRSELTRPVEAADLPAGVSLAQMLWELKRTCLAAVLDCLPPGVRLSFILTDLFGYEPKPAARLLNIRESAYRVRLTRARKRVDDHLTPRCVHVSKDNACSCDNRLGVALHVDFVPTPPHDDAPDRAFDSDPALVNTIELYRRLPPVRMSKGGIERTLGAFATRQEQIAETQREQIAEATEGHDLRRDAED